MALCCFLRPSFARKRSGIPRRDLRQLDTRLAVASVPVGPRGGDTSPRASTLNELAPPPRSARPRESLGQVRLEMPKLSRRRYRVPLPTPVLQSAADLIGPRLQACNHVAARARCKLNRDPPRGDTIDSRPQVPENQRRRASFSRSLPQESTSMTRIGARHAPAHGAMNREQVPRPLEPPSPVR